MAEIATENAAPMMIPATPPVTLRNTASARNCSSTCSRRAPIAMRRPISRVRSVTETSRMFMMPMPPTSSEIEATAASSSAMTAAAALRRRSAIWLRLRTAKSLVSPGLMRCRRTKVSVTWACAA